MSNGAGDAKEKVPEEEVKEKDEGVKVKEEEVKVKEEEVKVKEEEVKVKEEEVKVKEEENKEAPKEDNGKHDDECMDEEMDSEDEDDMDDMDDGGGGEGSGHQGRNTDYRLQLFLQFPNNKMLDRASVQALHPDITDIEIAKHRRFCWVTFATREKAEKALNDLSSVRLEGGQFLRVSWKENPNVPRRFRKDPEGKKKWIRIMGFPETATSEELKEAFFGVHRVQMGKKKNFKKNVPPGSAVLVFNSVKNAVDFMENKEKHVFQGKPLTEVKYLKEGPSKKTLKRKQRQQQKKKWDQEHRFHQQQRSRGYYY